MLDQPNGADILQAVARLLRDTLMPRLPADVVFQARVAANALDLVAREMKDGARLEEEALQRLRRLLDHDAPLSELEAELSKDIREGRIDVRNPQLLDHLWATTLAKVSIDQPTYASYRRELEQRASESSVSIASVSNTSVSNTSMSNTSMSNTSTPSPRPT